VIVNPVTPRALPRRNVVGRGGMRQRKHGVWMGLLGRATDIHKSEGLAYLLRRGLALAVSRLFCCAAHAGELEIRGLGASKNVLAWQ